MPLGVLFWVLFCLYLVLGLWGHRADIQGGNYAPAGGHVVLVFLIGILGWGIFGPVVR